MDSLTPAAFPAWDQQCNGTEVPSQELCACFLESQKKLSKRPHLIILPGAWVRRLGAGALMTVYATTQAY